MHEVHLVRELVAAIEKQAAAAGAKRVTRVKIKFNPLISHSAEHVRFCFDVVKKESTMLSGAELALKELPSLAQCQSCLQEVEVDELPALCPACGSINLQPADRTGLTLESFEVEK